MSFGREERARISATVGSMLREAVADAMKSTDRTRSEIARQIHEGRLSPREALGHPAYRDFFDERLRKAVRYQTSPEEERHDLEAETPREVRKAAPPEDDEDFSSRNYLQRLKDAP